VRALAKTGKSPNNKWILTLMPQSLVRIFAKCTEFFEQKLGLNSPYEEAILANPNK
jgi:hypothetical protein